MKTTIDITTDEYRQPMRIVCNAILSAIDTQTNKIKI